MSYLLDTNIVSEINRRTPNSGVLQWFDDTEETDLFISVITMGEIRRGIEQIRRRNQMDDERRAARLE